MIGSESIGREARHHRAHNQDQEVQDTGDKDRCRISTKTGETMADPPAETGIERTTAIGTTTQVVALAAAETTMTWVPVEE